MDSQTIRLAGLSDLDVHELRSVFRSGELTLEASSVIGRLCMAHEPTTIAAIVVLSASAIAGLSAWLLMQRHRGEIEKTFEIHQPDGTMLKHRVMLKASATTTDADVIRALGEQLGLSPAVVAKALAMGIVR